MTKLRAALAQINTTVGDLRGNTAKALDYIDRARTLGADLVSFPELTITGYPPEDLLYKHNLIRENREGLDRVIEHSAGIAVVVGFVLMVVGLGLGVTMIMLPVGLAIGLVGVGIFVWGLLGHLDSNK